MSPLWADRLRIALAPDGCTVVREHAAWRRTPVVTHRCQAPAVAGAHKWSGTLEALEQTLAQTGARAHRASARVSLSHHFVRFSVLPPLPEFDDAQAAALARQQLTGAYGESARDSRVTLHRYRRTGPVLVAAIDEALRTAVRETLRSRGAALRVIEPQLASVFNLHHRRFTGDASSFWLALAEPRRLLVAWCREGEWIAVRNQQTGGALEEELPLLLERMRMGEAREAEPGAVYLASSDGRSATPELSRPWSVQRLAWPFQAGGS